MIMQMTGYKQQDFRQPIFNCREEYRQRILDDMIYLFRYNYDQDF